MAPRGVDITMKLTPTSGDVTFADDKDNGLFFDLPPRPAFLAYRRY